MSTLFLFSDWYWPIQSQLNPFKNKMCRHWCIWPACKSVLWPIHICSTSVHPLTLFDNSWSYVNKSLFHEIPNWNDSIRMSFEISNQLLDMPVSAQMHFLLLLPKRKPLWLLINYHRKFNIDLLLGMLK